MSTRQLLNLTMGAFGLLLLAALGIVFSTIGSQNEQDTRVDLAMHQQVLIQELTRETAVLSDAVEREAVAAARENLAQTIVQFDRNLASLLHGGEVVDEAGRTVTVGRTGNDSARSALEEGARLWLQTGRPLADLAAGEYSVFSAAGQKAVAGLQANNVELMQYMGTAANSLRMGQHARAAIAGVARWAAAGLVLVLVCLVFFRRRLLGAEDKVTAGEPAASVSQTMPTTRREPIRAESRPPGRNAAKPALSPFTATVDFDSVSASVDQMSVDMNTIAGSTEKMRLAIDSVGNALQGMLYSLNEMAQDTAEGYKIVRNANNAASFTASAAGDLATSAREMAAVVARVTQLAHKTKQVAAQIDGEAVQTGKTGETFTSVVAGEVRGLSLQTNQATCEIEETVAGILATARQYEEAIGQIIKNVSAINRVSEHLGELMLSPPPHVEPVQPAPAALTPAPTAAPKAVAPDPAPMSPEPVQAAAETEPEEPTPAPPAPTLEDDPITPEATPVEMADETASAIAEAAEEPAPPETGEESVSVEDLDDDAVFILGKASKNPAPLNIPSAPTPDSARDQDVPTADEPETASDVADSTGVNEDDDVGLEVFMLNKPKGNTRPTPAADESLDDLVIGEADPADEPVARTVPEDEEPPRGEEGSNANIFMLNKPK